MNYILVILTFVGSNYNMAHYDWRPVGVFADAGACKNAATLIGKDGSNAKCIPTASAPATPVARKLP